MGLKGALLRRATLALASVVVALATLATADGVTAIAASGRVEDHAFESVSLAREMPYTVYLPPGYDAASGRYPVLFMLHGMGGSHHAWKDLGLFATADRLIRAGTIRPLVIVLPQGDDAYWVDHATDSERWGRYTARDLVHEIDVRYRVLDTPSGRAVGGYSMGAHGAIQLALHYPDVFRIVGAHSLVLRREQEAPAYFGRADAFAQRDPMQIVLTEPEVARHLALWIDIADGDPWLPRASAFRDELLGLGASFRWHVYPGSHSPAYWSAHTADYLRFYDGALHP